MTVIGYWDFIVVVSDFFVVLKEKHHILTFSLLKPDAVYATLLDETHEGHKWRRQRRDLQPVTFQLLQNYNS